MTQTLTLEITDNGDVVCAWFAMCENTTTECLPHPVLGPVPCCRRCATIGGDQTGELMAFAIDLSDIT